MNDFTADQANGLDKDPMTPEEVAMGFIQVANEAMCRPIRALTQVCDYTNFTESGFVLLSSWLRVHVCYVCIMFFGEMICFLCTF